MKSIKNKVFHAKLKSGAKVECLCLIVAKDKPDWVSIPDWKAHHVYLETKDTKFDPKDGIVFKKWATRDFTNTAWLVPSAEIVGIE